jgi:hypothetical protein
VALRQLLPLLSGARIAAEPAWKPNTVLRGLQRLWLDDARDYSTDRPVVSDRHRR